MDILFYGSRHNLRALLGQTMIGVACVHAKSFKRFLNSPQCQVSRYEAIAVAVKIAL